MTWWRYDIFKETPKTIQELHTHQAHKIAEKYKEGKFWFTPDHGKDHPSTLLISSGPKEPIKDEYKKLANPGDPKLIVEGTYTCDGKIFEFTPADGPTSKVAEALLKEKDFSVQFWSHFYMLTGISVLKFAGQVLHDRVMHDSEWVLCEWNLTRVLCLPNGDGVLKSPPLPGKWVQDGKNKVFVTPHGIELPEDWPIRVMAHGALVDAAHDSHYIAQVLHDPSVEIMAKKGEALKQQLLQIENTIAAHDTDPKKLKTLKAVLDELTKFEADFGKAVIDAVDEAWYEQVQVHAEYRQYKWDTRFKLTKNIVVTSLGVVGTVGGLAGSAAFGTTAPLAILGLLGTVKSVLDLGVDCWNIFRDVEGLKKELDKTLAVTLNDFVSKDKDKHAGWQNLGKSLLERVGFKGAQAVGAALGHSVKPVHALDEDVKHFSGKTAELNEKAMKLADTLPEVLKEMQKALDALDTKAADEAAKANPALAEKIKKQRQNLQGKNVIVLHSLFDSVGKNYQKFKQLRPALSGYQKTLEILEGKVNEEKVPGVIQNIFLPVVDLAWGAIDPSNIPATVMSCTSVALEICTNLLDMLELVGDRGKEAADHIKYLTDLSNALQAVAGALKH